MDQKLKFPDYENGLANLAQSVLKNFGIREKGQKTLACVDTFLEKEYENIAVFLLDGMGSRIMEKNLEETGFFRSHMKCSYSSVFPPTTVAATTSIRSGLKPCEHGWLGWDCYYPQIDQNVTVFTNMKTGTSIPAADYNVAEKYCGYETVVERINRRGGEAYEVMPFAEPFPKTMEEICGQVEMLCRKPGKKYIYAYWNEPDSTMHETGCYSSQTKQIMRKLEQQVQALSDKLEKTLLIVTADHGLVDTQNVSITDYPDIMECLVRMPSIEPRALNLFVKKEKKEQFEKAFRKAFDGSFLLLTKEQVIEKRLFGVEAEHPDFREMLGDYLAVGTGDLTIFSSREESEFFVGVHAGLREEEMMIPLIVVEKE